MAGLVPAIHAPLLLAVEGVDTRDKHGHDGQQRSIAIRAAANHLLNMGEAWVYIITNRPNGTLYTGVTTNLARRVWEHREGVVDGFTKRHGLKRLVYVERHQDIRTAIQREKNTKHWPRTWKVRLVLATNPTSDDLYDQLI